MIRLGVMGHGNRISSVIKHCLRAVEPEVRVVGPTGCGSDRVGTISFLHETKSSREITEAIDRTEVAIRHGHMYAWHLCDALGLDLEDGVVRVSFVHYNTGMEIDRLIEVFDRIL